MHTYVTSGHIGTWPAGAVATLAPLMSTLTAAGALGAPPAAVNTFSTSAAASLAGGAPSVNTANANTYVDTAQNSLTTPGLPAGLSGSLTTSLGGVNTAYAALGSTPSAVSAERQFVANQKLHCQAAVLLWAVWHA